MHYVAVVVGSSYAYYDYGKLLVFSLGADAEPLGRPKTDLAIPEQPPLFATAEELAQGDTL